MGDPIRILLADDHALMRAGLRSLLENIEGIEVIGEAANGREAVRLARQADPDIVAMDIAMPELNGIDATARITRLAPRSRIIIVSMHATRAHVAEALRAGAWGYVLKTATVEELETAIRMVTGGERYLTPAAAAALAEEYLRLQQGESGGMTGAELTARQREIVQLVAEGKSTREIALLLNLSVKTVETHRAQIRQRLDVQDTAGLVRYAIKAGLVPGD